MKKVRYAFTMIELLIVIVIIGILAKFGTELLLRIYEDYVVGTVNNRLLSHSEVAVTQIANRLQYRIRESMVVHQNGNIAPIANAVDVKDAGTAFEWVGYDVDGMRGDKGVTPPTWSGFIDVDNAARSTTNLVSPGSDWNRITSVITSLSPNGVVAPALFFVGDDSIHVMNGFGWLGALGTQNGNMHPIRVGAGVDQFAPTVGNFSGINVYEYYRLAWTAYAVELFADPIPSDPNRLSLRLWYGYQPWNGETYNQGTKQTLMQGVTSIAFATIGDTLKVQVCVGDSKLSGGTGAFSVCKEKTIY
ncbi:MAG: prepilin-type N-terminal cleavage/methylation domain-containing protein [Sulfuricurvum sp.]|uniref:prepilin-type N-terminal cleavage/methylation domain-containing protein n=1 Tax=Sulfuricurvum sp. TaxID=2025608 RepID=UPI00260E2283|nr:prepilin-type N-terminal cleavage/methylation domain-containing protein [Sulfuricurvum sp.]MDD2368302.1 prepilin-type N-terminal cleavage/methylation domain-containing protein [Sulfuricurvum sp.]MDD2949421.1 prepilin-type N-terminal cleavage/methylation domain-containing protein [Sulfuricurvum sp.]MDD5118439.1 prepilin-type N-terminal cleavage/methylation domain-containing protein [Sulfuricurvum sp.]